MKTVHSLVTGFFMLMLTAMQLQAQVFKVDTIFYSGDPGKRINLVVLGDGYRINDTAKFRADVLDLKFNFFGVPPFDKYQNFFNFFSIEVISNDAGNDHAGNANDEPGGQPVTSVDNYLESRFDFGGTHRCIYSSNTGLVFSILNASFPQYDVANVIVNTPYYGGCGGSVAYTGMNIAAHETFVHEFGHSFAWLADEYEYGTPCNPGNKQEVNVSQEKDTSKLVWKEWLTTSPIPTVNGTYCTTIGLYQGANYCSTNWYRPKCDCKMRTLNEPFCEICTERFISKMDSLVNLIDDYSPKTAAMSICSNATQQFNVTPMQTFPNTICTSWFIDNNPVPGNDNILLFDASLFAPGMHTIKALTSDTTLEVKMALASYSRVWTVNVFQPADGIPFSHSGDTLVSPFSQNSWFDAGDSSFASSSDTVLITRDGNYFVTGTDSNGCPGTSDTIFISRPAPAGGGILILPNPFTSEITITGHAISDSHVTISVTDVLGRAVSSAKANVAGNTFSTKLDTRKLIDGVYFLDVRGEGWKVVRKVVKE